MDPIRSISYFINEKCIAQLREELREERHPLRRYQLREQLDMYLRWLKEEKDAD